ncbi:MAG TPA: VanZ family protein [Thermodesulfovibrionales bacterium]|nr:VanZ family protein [Thermodesulfovibrionales bacterium]
MVSQRKPESYEGLDRTEEEGERNRTQIKGPLSIIGRGARPRSVAALALYEAHLVKLLVVQLVMDSEMAARQEMSCMRYFFKYWIPVLLWMIFIFWMSTGTFSAQNTVLIVEPVLRFFMPFISQEMTDMIHTALRKLGHIAEYFVLGILLFRAFHGSSKELRIPRWAFSSFFVLVLYAGSDELHQSFVSTRTASLYDVGIDVLGGIIALGFSALLHLSRQYRQGNRTI